MKWIWLLLAVIILPTSRACASSPNVLLIAIDDLNDWVGCLNGHPQAITPNIDRLANRGVMFRNAHCQAPVCQPSRASLMVSRLPSSTGLYFLNPGLEGSDITRNAITLPEAFANAGYRVSGAGKLFHNKANQQIFDRIGKYGGNFGGFGPRPAQKISQPHGHPLWDWGAFPERTAEMPDDKIARWAIKQLQQSTEEPFFLAVGFYRPHVPMYVPQRWFQMHPRESVRLPSVDDNDLSDLSDYARDLVTLEHVAPAHEWLVEHNQWSHAVQAYLASVTFVDHCVGMVLDALDKSGRADDTIVCLFSDHGFHLGEKQRWAKRSLWEDGTRVPMIFAGPSIKPATCDRPTGLIDVYPTLLQLCDLPPNPQHEGQSLVALLNEPNRAWQPPATTTFGPGNHAIRSIRWRYIRYRDGSEELYDHEIDPHEWTNLAAQQKYEAVLEDHRRWLPKSEQPVLGEKSTGHKAYAAAGARHSVN